MSDIYSLLQRGLVALPPEHRPTDPMADARNEIARRQAEQARAEQQRELAAARKKEGDILVAREQARAERERLAALDAEARMKDEAHEVYVAGGGSEGEFARDWPALKSRLLAEQALHPATSNVDVLRERFAQKYNGYV